MGDMMKFVLESKMADNLVKLARSVPYDLTYSQTDKAIYILVVKVPTQEDGEEYEEGYHLLLKLALNDAHKEVFRLELDSDIPQSVSVKFGFPLFFETLEGVVEWLNRPDQVLNLGLEIVSAVKESQASQPNDLAASAIFSTE
jgi:hypothetical protein